MSDSSEPITIPGEFSLKRLRDNVSFEDVSNFLNHIKNTKFVDGDVISYPFADIFQNVTQTDLYLSTKSRQQSIKDNENPGLYLYKSDLAFLYADVFRIFGDEKLEEFSATDEYSLLKNIISYCQDHDNQENISVQDDEYLNNLLTDHVSGTASFLIPLIKNEKNKETEEVEEEKEETENSKSDEKRKKDLLGAAIVAGQKTETDKKDKQTDDGENKTDKSSFIDEKENDPVALKKALFSKELRDQAAKFTGIALSQLEQQSGLPPGTLAYSDEFKDLHNYLSDKTLGFFLTTLSEGRLDDLVNPETRLTLIREYIWLVQNDFRTTAIIANRLKTLDLKDLKKANEVDPTDKGPIEFEYNGQKITLRSDKDLKGQVKQALTAAEAGTGPAISELITNIAENPELKNVFTELKKEKLVVSKGNYLAKESAQLLKKELKRLGVSDDKLQLAEKNVVNVIDSWILQGLPIDLLSYVDEGRFKLIFGEEIPYNPDFLESLGDIWIARRSIIGKKTGQLLLHNEARFAVQEALELLDKNKKGLTKKESDRVFENAVATPTKQLLVGSKEAPVKDPEEIVSLINDKKNVTNAEKRELFLKQVWLSKDTDTKKEILVVLGYGEANSKTIQNIAENVDFYPREIGLHDMAPLLGGAAFYSQDEINNFNSDYIPNNGMIQSPLSNVNQFAKKTKGLGKKLKRGVKGVRSKLSKKAAKKAADKVAEAGLSKAASTATGSINPVLGFLTKLASTKKGRKTLIALGGLGLGSLVIPLTTLGGQIGSVIGGIVGGIFGGPGGAVAGAIGGGWTGYAFQNWFGELGSGTKGSNFGANWGGSASNQVTAGKAATTSTATTTATTAPTYNIGGITTFQPGSFIGESLVHVGGQAILGTVAAVAGTSVLVQSIISSALVADFPVVEPLSTISGSIPGKESEYVTIEKRAFIAGCPENKCENPAFPIKVEYTITISPKGNYTIQLLEATDTLKVNHSEKAWEEHEGKKPPTIPDRIKNMSDFSELYEEMILTPGDSVTLTYSETLDSDYNHSSVLNTFDLKVYAKDPETGEEGTDNAITGEVVYIGDYSQGAGCWPASGTITQLPGGSYSHGRVDAFDIANSEGTTIFAPFSGTACPGNLDPGYGIHVVLSDTEVGTFVFGHFRSRNINECKEVVAGEVLGQMGNTGNSSGPHLHFELRGSAVNSGTLPSLMPDGASVKVNDPVRTCYE